MSWTDPIDAYCERTSADFWAEPFNALSNAAFLLAALLAFLAWRSRDRARLDERRARDGTGLFLVWLVAVIGLGSFLFHGFANGWSSLADVLPIAVFIHVYFAVALYRFVGLPLAVACGAALLFLAASSLGSDLFVPLLGSSSGYVPALLALYGIGLVLFRRGQAQARLVLGAGLVFTLSLAFRIADGPLCSGFPIGTHFLWHGLNAATLGLLLAAVVREGPRRRLRRITA